MDDLYMPDVVEVVEAPPNRVKVVFGRRAVYIYKLYASGYEGKLVFHRDEATAIAKAILEEMNHKLP